VFTKLLPGNALVKSATIFYRKVDNELGWTGSRCQWWVEAGELLGCVTKYSMGNIWLITRFHAVTFYGIALLSNHFIFILQVCEATSSMLEVSASQRSLWRGVWDVTLCNLVDVYRCFGDTYCLHFQGRNQGRSKQQCYLHGWLTSWSWIWRQYVHL
jgi:hypothetical protein